MGKTQVLSALGLAFILGTLSNNYSYAMDATSTTGAVERESIVLTAASESAQNVERTKSLPTAVNDVEKVLEETKNVTNTEYPGLREYLQGLVDESKNSKNQGSQELTEALEEASVAAALLTGTYKSSAVADKSSAATRTIGKTMAYATTTQKVEAEEEPVAEKQATPAVELANATVTVTVVSSEETKAGTVDEENLDKTADKQNLEQIAEQSSDEAIEVPKTGEAKTNFGILIVAGVGVVVATLGATVAILRSRKNA